MSIYITSDLANIFLRNSLDSSMTSYNKSIQRLSSGSKFTSVGDDPVGISRNDALSMKISSTAQAMSNVSVGSNLLSLAEGGQNTVISNLQRIKNLCMQAANETYSSEDKDAILAEVRARLGAIDKVAETTKFANINLLDGTSGNLELQIGTSESATMFVGGALINVHASQLGSDIRIDPSITGATWLTGDISTYMGKVDDAVNQLTATEAMLGSYQNRLTTTNDILTSTKNNLTESRSTISDSDVAEESANMASFQILKEISASLLTQANQIPSYALSLIQ